MRGLRIAILPFLLPACAAAQRPAVSADPAYTATMTFDVASVHVSPPSDTIMMTVKAGFDWPYALAVALTSTVSGAGTTSISVVAVVDL